MPFLREAVDIMCADPQKYGLCGHRINQLLTSQTLNSFDLSLRVLDPVAPIPPAEPSLETIRAELPPTIASPSLTKEPAKETSKDTSKKSAKASAEGKEEEPVSTSTITPAVDAESLLKKAQEKHRIEMEMWKISYRRYCEDLEDARKHDMAALALLLANMTQSSKTRLTTSHLADYAVAMSSKSGVKMAKLLLISHKPTDIELQESRLKLKKSFEALRQGSFQMELFIAKHMQIHKGLLDVGYSIDDLETRFNFCKALSLPSFLTSLTLRRVLRRGKIRGERNQDKKPLFGSSSEPQRSSS